ncbi:hypothetical protein Aduo_019999 [Ancylostoma duodenale]
MRYGPVCMLSCTDVITLAITPYRYLSPACRARKLKIRPNNEVGRGRPAESCYAFQTLEQTDGLCEDLRPGHLWNSPFKLPSTS